MFALQILCNCSARRTARKHAFRRPILKLFYTQLAVRCACVWIVWMSIWLTWKHSIMCIVKADIESRSTKKNASRTQCSESRLFLINHVDFILFTKREISAIGGCINFEIFAFFSSSNNQFLDLFSMLKSMFIFKLLTNIMIDNFDIISLWMCKWICNVDWWIDDVFPINANCK